MDEDVFDEGICDDILPEEWAKVERSRKTDGFREGLEAGQEAALQEGFNLGFSEGIVTGFSTSFMRGLLSALITNYQSMDKELDEEAKAALCELEVIMSDLESLQHDLSPQQASQMYPDKSGIRKADGISDVAASLKNVQIDGASGKEGPEDGKCESKEETRTASASSSRDVNGAKSAVRGVQLQYTENVEVTGDEAKDDLRPIVSAASDNSESGKGRCDKALSQSGTRTTQRIVERLQPHLQRLQCEDILTSYSHPFLQI